MSSSKTSLSNRTLSAWLLVIVFGCSGNASLGSGVDSGVGGTTGGAFGTGGTFGTGGGASTATAGVKCGTAVCGASEECCNPSCSQCVSKGYSCIMSVCSSGGSSSLGGDSGAGGSATLPGMHESCVNKTCTTGLTPVEFYGIAGTSGPLFCSCEIPCPDGKCPNSMRCQYVGDGPGPVCYAQ